jgi:hypothetical protein
MSIVSFSTIMNSCNADCESESKVFLELDILTFTTFFFNTLVIPSVLVAEEIMTE